MSRALPTISIVSAVYNKAAFVEAMIDSVLSQGYPKLDFIIFDGGSTDGTADIIRRYEKHLACWASETDKGQWHALNKGLDRSIGDVIGWQNGDDLYLPGAFAEAASHFASNMSLDLLIGDIHVIDGNGAFTREMRFPKFSLEHLVYAGWNLSSQSAFWSRHVMERVGRFKEECGRHTADFDWFIRIAKESRHVEHVRRFWGAYRHHPDTVLANVSFEARWPTIIGVLEEHGVRVDPNRPWARQFRAKRATLLAKQIASHIRLGNLAYLCHCAIRRRHILP